jgi:hypothetical protein
VTKIEEMLARHEANAAQYKLLGHYQVTIDIADHRTLLSLARLAVEAGEVIDAAREYLCEEEWVEDPRCVDWLARFDAIEKEINDDE